MGIRPDEYYKLTLKEVTLRGESWKIKNNKQWEQTRYLSALIKDAGLIARGGKVNMEDYTIPQDLFPLPQDKIWARVKKTASSSVKKFQSFFEKAKKSGFEFKKDPDFEKLKEDYR